MSNCIHCGKPAGLLRTYHAECRAQFDRAITTIPAFFEKLLQSLLPADRFEQLLKEVAGTFHITPEQLRSLSMTGINAMLDSALSRHLPSIAEEERILSIATTLGFSMSDVPGLNDKLVKISVLRDLDEGRIPDRVTVVGPMPFELEAEESIIWIFNGIKNYREPKSKEPMARNTSPVRRDMPDYFAPASLGSVSARTRESVEMSAGDLMITDRHIFVVSDDRHRKIPFAKLAGLSTFSDGFQVARLTADDRPLAFIVDDPWFASNLLTRLMRLTANIPAPAHESGPVSVK